MDEASSSGASNSRRRGRFTDAADNQSELTSPPAKLPRRESTSPPSASSDGHAFSGGGLVAYDDAAHSDEKPRLANPFNASDRPSIAAESDAGERLNPPAGQSSDRCGNKAATSIASANVALEDLSSSDNAGNSTSSGLVDLAAPLPVDASPPVSRRHPRLEGGSLPPEVEDEAPPEIIARFTTFLRATLEVGPHTTLQCKSWQRINVAAQGVAVCAWLQLAAGMLTLPCLHNIPRDYCRATISPLC